MKITHEGPTVRGFKSNDGLTQFVPLSEIRRRVDRIKRQWNQDTAKARAAEGQRRRDELELLLGELLLDDEVQADSSEMPEFSVVG